METIRHKLVVKASPEQVYEAVTTQDGIKGWWCKDTTAKPELGFLNLFIFGPYRNEMKVTALEPAKKVEWQCMQSVDEWVDTSISFELEEKNGNTILRFQHAHWRAATDFFAACNYDWALFMKSLKTFCETGTGNPQ